MRERERRRVGPRHVAGPLLFLALLALPGPVSRACIVNFSQNANSPAGFNLFPNWTQALVTQFDIEYCDDVTCSGGFAGDLVGLTLYNYGSADGVNDITDISFCVNCRTACTGPTQTMTYAGVWTVGAGNYPAWTWAGSLLFDDNPCESGGGSTPCTPTPCFAVMSVWVDVGPCPTNNATLSLGPGYNPTLNPGWPGGVTDQYGCAVPLGLVQDQKVKRIVYASKTADKVNASPGDTINYTIHYGKAGTAPLSNIVIFDTLPQYTHYIAGSAVPPPDPGWDPDIGPPKRLKWTAAGGVPGAGATAEVRFQLYVDWGNEPFDSNSGAPDQAAPENARLGNRAEVFFEGTTCSPTSAVTPAAETVIRRFRFWKEADNDMLFASSLGQPPDEIIYKIYIQNLSATKTWWNVVIWDTVPPELDSWCVNCGFEDPCLGWTMSPSGCAAAGPGALVTGAKSDQTLLTWRLDMPPGRTLALRWKAQVRSATSPGSTAVNIVAVQAMGFNGSQGTGNSGRPAYFTHLAPIVLATTYVSYTSYFGADTGNTTCPGIYVPFFPLNRKADFAFYGLEYQQPTLTAGGIAYSTFGGVSDSIGNFIGTCTGGFTSFQPGGLAGCGPSRAPAMYDPLAWQATCPDLPFHFVYKVVSNAPFLWQMITRVLNDNQDRHLYVPSTTLTFRGFTLYTYRVATVSSGAGHGDSLTIINASMDSTNTYDPALTTTVYLFKWSGAPANTWNYVRSMDLDVESAGVVLGTTALEQGFYRVISSQSSLIIHQGWNIFDTLSAGGCCDNYGTLSPNSTNGNVVSPSGSGRFYAIVEPWGSPNANADWTAMRVGNHSGGLLPAADADYRIWRYEPAGAAPAPMPAGLAGTSGKWVLVQVDNVPAGLFPGNLNPPNPHVYGGRYDRTGIVGSSTGLFKVELINGGPISVQTGLFLPNVYAGGAVMHAADGQQVGQEFWYHQSGYQSYSCGGGADPPISALAIFDLFNPKQGTAIQAVSSDGYDSTYTTSGPDQVITFMKMSHMQSSNRRVWKMNVLTGTNPVVALYNNCMTSEKGYTSPFVRTGVHYIIVTPPVAYVGQNFWITVVVVRDDNVTETDYCATSGFTSSDPNAQIQSFSMGTYTYEWSSTANCPDGSDDDGVAIFVNVQFTQLGQQSIVVYDLIDGSITGFASIMIVGADVKLFKEPKLAVAASSDTVQFRICWSNYSSATAFGFTITDAVPRDTTYVPDTVAGHRCGIPAGVSVDLAYSTSTANPPAASQYVTISAGSPPASTRWLKWTVRDANVNSSGCVCFKVRVN